MTSQLVYTIHDDLGPRTIRCRAFTATLALVWEYATKVRVVIEE